MKKFFFTLMLAVAAGTATYAGNGVKSDVKNGNALAEALQNVKQKIADAPSGTTYGVTGREGDNIVLNTPVGKYTVERCSDGAYSFMGFKAKLLAAKHGVYTVKTSLGTWVLDTHKCTVKKK